MDESHQTSTPSVHSSNISSFSNPMSSSGKAISKSDVNKSLSARLHEQRAQLEKIRMRRMQLVQNSTGKGPSSRTPFRDWANSSDSSNVFRAPRTELASPPSTIRREPFTAVECTPIHLSAINGAEVNGEGAGDLSTWSVTAREREALSSSQHVDMSLAKSIHALLDGVATQSKRHQQQQQGHLHLTDNSHFLDEDDGSVDDSLGLKQAVIRHVQQAIDSQVHIEVTQLVQRAQQQVREAAAGASGGGSSALAQARKAEFAATTTGGSLNQSNSTSSDSSGDLTCFS